MMAFDHCVALPAERRCRARCGATDHSVGTTLSGQPASHGSSPLWDRARRLGCGSPRSARRVTSSGLAFEGYAVGGLSVGESRPRCTRMLDVTVPELPASKPRYLMGVGHAGGSDRRSGARDRSVRLRGALSPWADRVAVYEFGRVVIKQARYVRDEQPIDPACGCPVCARYSRAYLHHLFQVKEMLSRRLNTIHNLWYFADLMGHAPGDRGGTLRRFGIRFTGSNLRSRVGSPAPRRMAHFRANSVNASREMHALLVT